MRSLLALASALVLIALLTTMSTIKPAAAAPAPITQAFQPGMQGPQPGRAVEGVTGAVPVASTPPDDPASFGKLNYKPPMDSQSVMQRANTGGDVMCPGTEPCGP